VGHLVRSLRDRGCRHGCHHDFRHGCHHVHCQNYHLGVQGHCLDEAGHLLWNLHLLLWLSHLRLNYLCRQCCLLGGVDLPKMCGLRRL
jgi:hypothetical protein